MKDENITTPFYSAFLQLCDIKGKTPSAVAAEAGISSGAPTAWKKGAVPKPAQRGKLCAYFGVPDDALLGYAPIKRPSTSEDGGQVEPWEVEARELLRALSPELRARELAYLRELVSKQGTLPANPQGEL